MQKQSGRFHLYVPEDKYVPFPRAWQPLCILFGETIDPHALIRDRDFVGRFTVTWINKLERALPIYELRRVKGVTRS